jgi:cytidylate kinase
MDLEMSPTPPGDRRLYTVTLEGRDETSTIRASEVDAAVSAVSEHRQVRDAVLPVQRRLGRARAVVVGRDIGTVVLPDADRKIYLDASEEVRACRRLPERRRSGRSVDYPTVLAEIRRRDALDSSRAVAPLRAAADAITVLTDHLTEDEVVELLVEICCGRLGEPATCLVASTETPEQGR